MKVKVKTSKNSKLDVHKPEDYFVYRDRDNHGNFPAFSIANILLEPRTAKRYGHCVSVSAMIDLGDRMKAFFISKNDVSKISEFILNKIINEPNFISNTKIESDKLGEVLLNFTQQYPRLAALSMLTNKELAGIHSQYYKLYTDFHFINTPPWLIAGGRFADYLKKLLDKVVNKKEFLKYFTLFTTPTAPSYTFKQELDFLKIISVIQENKELSDVFYKQKPQQIKKFIKTRPVWNLIKKHAEKFEWIPFNYAGPTLWNEIYFIKEIKSFLKQKKSVKKELVRLAPYHKNLKTKQEIARKKLKISKNDFRLFQDIQTLAVLQDNHKETAIQSCVWLVGVMRKEISKRLGLSLRALKYITEDEVVDMLLGKKRIAKQALERRWERVIIKKTRAGYEIITGKRVDKLWKELTPKTGQKSVIKGVSAALGKIKGRVKVLLSPKDIGKVRNGDILVASMTTPNYIPAMKKAAAVVTDEGGVTCHAAIVSRELGIPCIIGTKIATKVLRDNDLVEVDANKGKVKILKKSRG